MHFKFLEKRKQDKAKCRKIKAEINTMKTILIMLIEKSKVASLKRF
jgi:hypothetical protein